MDDFAAGIDADSGLDVYHDKRATHIDRFGPEKQPQWSCWYNGSGVGCSSVVRSSKQ